ncbi:MAG: hypothetical protein P8N48_03565, partial [Bacteroidales bacterium]|nr:hypothetical protein [Bacteroidales bacterium]
RREYSGILATVVGFTFIDDIRRYFETEEFILYTPWHYAVMASLVVVIILRSFKHYTSVLQEEGRS